MKNFYLALFALFFMGIGKSNAQYTLLHTFNDTLGGLPNGDLTISGKTLYGMTSIGGTHQYGCIFSIDTNGNRYKVLLDFNSTNGKTPYGSLILSKSRLYGMTCDGGAYDSGCIFSIDTNGNGYIDLLDFNCANGAGPEGSLILSGKNLYGMTAGFSTSGECNYGNVFSIDTDGTNYKELFAFNGSNGGFPRGSLLLVGEKLYGMTNGGPKYLHIGWGNIFAMNTDGSNFTVLHNFNLTDGGNPWYGVLTLSGGTLFGMTSEEESVGTNVGNVFSIDTNGTGYKELHVFTGGDAFPWGSLILNGSNLYGMVRNGGVHEAGDIFSIDTNGANFNELFDFFIDSGREGGGPTGSLIILGNTAYGMTAYGGDYNKGVIFSFRDTAIKMPVNELTQNSVEVKFFPNPTNGKFTIQLQGVNNSSLDIYNALGQKIYTSSLIASTNQIDLSGDAAGVYLYRILSQTGDVISAGKFVIER